MKKEGTTEVLRLSVIDDHPVVFLGIQLAIKIIKAHSIEFVHRYTTGNQVIENIDNLNSDVLLIDMCLPDINGYELTAKILKVYPDMKIGIYSSMLDKDYVLNAFSSGAMGYLSKSASPQEIIDFIFTISRGERYIRGVIADIVFADGPLAKHPFNITKREKEILDLVILGFKNREIAEKLFIAERTVEFHKQNIYQKLEVNNSIDLYKSAKRLNLV